MNSTMKESMELTHIPHGMAKIRLGRIARNKSTAGRRSILSAEGTVGVMTYTQLEDDTEKEQTLNLV